MKNYYDRRANKLKLFQSKVDAELFSHWKEIQDYRGKTARRLIEDYMRYEIKRFRERQANGIDSYV